MRSLVAITVGVVLLGAAAGTSQEKQLKNSPEGPPPPTKKGLDGLPAPVPPPVMPRPPSKMPLNPYYYRQLKNYPYVPGPQGMPGYSPYNPYGQAPSGFDGYMPSNSSGYPQQPGAGGYAPAAEQPRPNAPVEVAIFDNYFYPSVARVTRGGKVRWTNYGTQKHTVTNYTGSWDSGDLAPGQSFTLTVPQALNFYYYCRYHRLEMNGTLRVK